MLPVDLNAELWRAIKFAQSLPPPIAVGLAETFPRHVQWGFARVAYYGQERRRYEPQPDGPVLAFIVPCVEEGGELIDLAAIDPDTQHVGTRLGYARGLGLQAVGKARFSYDLGLIERPLDWLRDPVDTVYLFSLADLPVALDGVHEFTCSSIALAERVRAMLPPSVRHRVLGPS